MSKKLLYLFTAIFALIIISLFTFILLMQYEPTPSRSKVEGMTNAKDLIEFGDVEGTYLYTPKNYGFYNKNSIYIVEKSLGQGEQYDDQYVVIKKGQEITDKEKLLVELIRDKYMSAARVTDVQVKSKHKVLVYKENEKVTEDWFFKVTFAYNDDKLLSFVSPKQGEKDQFNFFTNGYQQFLNF